MQDLLDKNGTETDGDALQEVETEDTVSREPARESAAGVSVGEEV